jgi:hypothetical protein
MKKMAETPLSATMVVLRMEESPFWIELNQWEI